MWLLDEYPNKKTNFSKLPKTQNVLLALLDIILSDESRKGVNPNQKTVVSRDSLIRASKETCKLILEVWKHHFGKLIDDPKHRIIVPESMIKDKIMKLYKKYKDLERFSRRKDSDTSQSFLNKVDEFKATLCQPFNIVIKNYEVKFEKSGITNWKVELEHLENQLKPTQVGTVVGLDKHQEKREKRKSEDAARLEAARKKALLDKADNRCDDSNILDEEEGSLDYNFNDIDPGDSDYTEAGEEVINKPRAKKINVMGTVARSGMARRVSHANQAVIAAATCRALNIDINTTNISLTSAARHNKIERANTAKNIREQFEVPQFVSLHYDGKQITTKGRREKSNRVSVSIKEIAPEGMSRILSVPESQSGSGADEAAEIINVLKHCSIKSEVCSLCYDTAFNNTGRLNGANKIIEEHIGHPVLWCACRHHTSELIVKALHNKLNGNTTEPGVPLFKRLYKSWEETIKKVDYSCLCVLDTTSLPDFMKKMAAEAKIWAEEALKKETFPRGDYKEFITLVFIFLGGKVVNFKFALPGPDHHAR